MTLGSEFRFHGSLTRKPIPEGSGMKLYQLKNGSDEWVTQNTVTDTVAEAIREIMEGRGRNGHYRLADPQEEIAPKKRARVRKTPAKPAETTATNS